MKARKTTVGEWAGTAGAPSEELLQVADDVVDLLGACAFRVFFDEHKAEQWLLRTRSEEDEC